MTDVFDRASDMEQSERDSAWESHRQMMEDKAATPSAECCGVCGEPIPPARRRAEPGCKTCVPCQEELDRALKGY